MIEKENVRKLFEEVAANPLRYGEKIDERLRTSVSSSFNQLLNDEKWSNWVLKELYPLLVQHMENRKTAIEVRVWALKRVGDVARQKLNQAENNEAENKLIKIWFAGDTDPDDKLGKEVKLQLLWLASKLLFKKVRVKVESKDTMEKMKAEELLKDIILSWSPRLQNEIARVSK